MLNQVFATKLKMSQGWTTAGKRVAITRCIVNDNLVVAEHNLPTSESKIFEIGYGKKKLKNVTKPLRTKLEKSGFSNGISTLHGVHNTGDDVKVGDKILLNQVLEVGDVVKVQGISKGRGFAGAMKRHNFHGGPKTHGQSDRARAVGSIGAGTTPGHVWKGKKMPGHYGNATATVMNLVVLHIEENEVWLSGPVPGAINSAVKITKLGEKNNVVLDKKASGIKETEVKEEVPSGAQVKTEEK